MEIFHKKKWGGNGMALMNCPECNNEVSDTARTCPHCGYHLKKFIITRKTKAVIFCICLALIAVIGINISNHLKPVGMNQKIYDAGKEIVELADKVLDSEIAADTAYKKADSLRDSVENIGSEKENDINMYTKMDISIVCGYILMYDGISGSTADSRADLKKSRDELSSDLNFFGF